MTAEKTSSESSVQPWFIIPKDRAEALPGVIPVLPADDHSIFREGLRILFTGCSDIQVAGEAGNGKEAILLLGRLLPDVVGMDINMPVMNGIDAARLI